MRLLIFLLVIVTPAFASVFDERGKPKKELLAILDALYVPHTGEVQSIFEGTKPLLRNPNTERQDLSEKALTYEQKNVLLNALTGLGFVDSIKPDSMSCDDILVLGSDARDVRARMEYLIQLYQDGLRFKRIFFLTGERYRDPSLEPDRVVFFNEKVPHVAADVETEAGIMRAIWLQLDKTKELAEMRPIIIDAPQKVLAKGKKRRPNTYDTIELLLKGCYTCEGRSWIAISSQPYVSYQEALMKRSMPSSYQGQVVGPKAPPSTLFSHYLDTLARAVHNEFWRLHPECTPIN